MSYLMSAVLGFVQGVAEFLPISSSGHLTLFQHFFGMEQADMMFNILLHFATLIAVCIYYFRDIRDMICQFFLWLGELLRPGKKSVPMPDARRLVLLIVMGTLPLFAVLLFKDAVEQLNNSPALVCCALLLTGTILFLSDRMVSGKKNVRTAGMKDALIVGLAQGLATVPGLSRSGCTITMGLAVGFERKFAVRYSFLMSLPAVLGATLLEVVDALSTPGAFDSTLLPKYLLGMAVAGVVGYFAIALVNLLVDKGRFGRFAYYCWGAGALFLFLSLTGWTLL